MRVRPLVPLRPLRPLLPLLPIALSTLLVAQAAGCEWGRLRPLNPCTTAGLSEHVEIDDVTEVDLLFMIDDSGSMREEQEKLRRELPRMVNALITGDLDEDGDPDGPRVKSLRVGIVTSDMGVGGIGEQDIGHAIQSCGAAGSSFDGAAAHYGDDGVLHDRALEASVVGSPASYDCDLDDDGNGDVVAAGTLPTYLTFDADDGPPDAAALDEFVRRVACLTNVGVAGCAFEQQLESVLKAVTPPSATDGLLGGAFHHRGNEVDARLGHGRGPDPIDANARNASWFRDDSLLAIVLVTDEDDCSASDPTVYDFLSDRAGFDDPYDQYQSQTRCVRYEGELVHPIERYARGLLARRSGHEGRLVFAAITGVPADLTDEDDEGVDAVGTILADPRMTVTLQPNERVWNGMPTQIPDGEIAPACQHAVVGAPVLTATATLGTTSATIEGVVVSGTPLAGMGVSGPGIQPGTLVRGVTGTGPYTLQLSARPLTAGVGVTLTLTELDVSAVPARRIVRVAEALTAKTTAQPEVAHAIVQSICVDDFRPAVQRILRLIQSQLSSGCLPRPLIRTRANVVACDVLVTLPAGIACDDPTVAGIYSDDAGESERVVVGGVTRARCTMRQVPVGPAAAGAPDAGEASRLPAGAKGWYYDDFTAELPLACVTDTQRIAFVMGSKPPDGAQVDFSCLSSVQDGDLAVDIGSACTSQCAFPTEADAREFTLRYNLGARGFDPAVDFRCEPESNSCQIHCGSDAECPGGYVCFDDTGAAEAICVNPVCGSGL